MVICLYMAETGDSPKPTNIATTDGATAGSVKAPTAGTNTTANQSSSDKKLVFNSAEIGTKTARKQDAFAEHKRKDAEKKAKNKVTRRRVLIFGGLGLVLAGVVVTIIVKLIGQEPTPVDELPPEEQIKNVDANFELSTTVYQKAQEAADNGGSANEAFDEAIDNAGTVAEANVIRVAQMRYINTTNGDNTNEIIAIGEATATNRAEPCEDPMMDVHSRAVCHNLLAIAYYEEMKHEKSEYHEQRAEELTGEYMKLRGEEGL